MIMKEHLRKYRIYGRKTLKNSKNYFKICRLDAEAQINYMWKIVL